MPLYEIQHSTPLTPPQRDALASAITTNHARKFTTPSLFVNVRFINSGDGNEHNYIGGKERKTNRIVAHVRSGGPRKDSDFDELALKVQDIWDEVVNPEHRKEKQATRVFVLGDITAGVEGGFLLPKAGGDVAWLQENLPKFEELAANGDGDFAGLVKELQERGDLGKIYWTF